MAKKITFESWLREYLNAFADEMDITVKEAQEILNINPSMARGKFDRGISPESAGRKDARFAFYGEW